MNETVNGQDTIEHEPRDIKTVVRIGSAIAALCCAGNALFNALQFGMNAEAREYAQSDELSSQTSQIASQLFDEDITVSCEQELLSPGLTQSIFEPNAFIYGQVWPYKYAFPGMGINSLPPSNQPNVIKLRSFICNILVKDQTTAPQSSANFYPSFSYALLAHEYTHLTHPDLDENDTQCVAIDSLQSTLPRLGYSAWESFLITEAGNSAAKQKLGNDYYERPCK